MKGSELPVTGLHQARQPGGNSLAGRRRVGGRNFVAQRKGGEYATQQRRAFFFDSDCTGKRGQSRPIQKVTWNRQATCQPAQTV
jgi:hypothetical protein